MGKVMGGEIVIIYYKWMIKNNAAVKILNNTYLETLNSLRN